MFFYLEDTPSLLDNMDALEDITMGTDEHGKVDCKNEFGLEEPNQTLLSKQDYDDNIDVETALPSKNLPDDAKVLKYQL